MVSVLDFCATKSYELPLNVGFVLELKTSIFGGLSLIKIALPSCLNSTLPDFRYRSTLSFVFVEFHPVVWMFSDNFKKVTYNYFNSEPIIETESETYADREANLTHKYVS